MDEDAGGRSGPDLYLVIAEGGGALVDLASERDAFALSPTMLLVRAGETRPQRYHFVKRRLAPERLSVACLEGAPKFKSYAAGALNWLRGRPGHQARVPVTGAASVRKPPLTKVSSRDRDLAGNRAKAG